MTPTTATTVDVRVVRWVDGYRIVHNYYRISHGEALALRFAEECLPGTLIFTQEPTPRPWEAGAPIVLENGRGVLMPGDSVLVTAGAPFIAKVVGRHPQGRIIVAPAAGPHLAFPEADLQFRPTRRP